MLYIYISLFGWNCTNFFTLHAFPENRIVLILALITQQWALLSHALWKIFLIVIQNQLMQFRERGLLYCELHSCILNTLLTILLLQSFIFDINFGCEPNLRNIIALWFLRGTYSYILFFYCVKVPEIPHFRLIYS